MMYTHWYFNVSSADPLSTEDPILIFIVHVDTLERSDVGPSRGMVQTITRYILYFLNAWNIFMSFSL